jgi:hypothetical protein
MRDGPKADRGPWIRTRRPPRGHPARLAVVPHCRPVGVVAALGADQPGDGDGSASMAWSIRRVTTDMCCDVQGYAHRLRADGAQVALPGERAADPFGHYGMAGGAAALSDLLDVPLAEQSNGWLTGSGRLGDRRPKTRRTPWLVPTQASPKSARMLHGH